MSRLKKFKESGLIGCLNDSGVTSTSYKNEWIKIDKSGKMPDMKGDFLLSDEYGHVYIGHTAFDYYDAEYWFPLPRYPFQQAIITNDEWVKLCFDKEDIE